MNPPSISLVDTNAEDVGGGLPPPPHASISPEILAGVNWLLSQIPDDTPHCVIELRAGRKTVCVVVAQPETPAPDEKADWL